MLLKTIVRPEHLNHHGKLFGGYMLHWVDEFAYIAALEDYPSVKFVTRGMEAASFTRSVSCGAILTFDIQRTKVGRTSVTYRVHVTARKVEEPEGVEVFNTGVTFCAVDDNGQKMELPPMK